MGSLAQGCGVAVGVCARHRLRDAEVRALRPIPGSTGAHQHACPWKTGESPVTPQLGVLPDTWVLPNKRVEVVTLVPLAWSGNLRASRERGGRAAFGEFRNCW